MLIRSFYEYFCKDCEASKPKSFYFFCLAKNLNHGNKSFEKFCNFYVTIFGGDFGKVFMRTVTTGS